MDNYSPRFQRQPSCSCTPVMARISSRGFVRGFDADDEFDVVGHSLYNNSRPAAAAAARSTGTKLRGLWKKIMREKRKILRCTAGAVGVAPAPAAREQYDAYTYAQNFDDGAAWVEPENLSRSFSARFAVPSRVLQSVA